MKHSINKTFRRKLKSLSIFYLELKRIVNGVSRFMLALFFFVVVKAIHSMCNESAGPCVCHCAWSTQLRMKCRWQLIVRFDLLGN